MSPSAARVVGLGMACPLGVRWRSAVAAMNAGISRFLEREDVLVQGEPARASMLAGRDLPLTGRSKRAAFFARHALEDAVTGAGELPPDPLTCVLALPSPRVGPRIDPQEVVELLSQVRTGAGVPVNLSLHRVVEEGRAGTFLAIESAITLLARGRTRLVLVAGVDSLADTETLTALADRNRLLSRANRDGIIPGEGAACILLGGSSTAPQFPALAHLRSIAVAREPIPFEGTHAAASVSEGLSAVFRKLRLEVGGRVDEIFAGTTCEVFFGREFANAYLRNGALMPEPLRQRTLSGTLGDMGAAAGAISLVRAIIRLGPEGPGNRGVPNRLGLAYASSDDGLVGGCVVAGPR